MCGPATSLFLLLAASALAQVRGLQVRVEHDVIVSEPGAPHLEPHISADPKDSSRLIVAAAHSSGAERAYVETYVSDDGGASWRKADLPLLRDLVASGDVDIVADNWLAHLPDGSVICAVVAGTLKGHPWGRVPVLIYRSVRGDGRWEGPLAFGPVFDRPTLAVDGQRVYVAAMTPGLDNGQAVTILRSDDGGTSFIRGIVWTHDDLGHGPMHPVILPQRALLVPFLEFGVRQRLTTSRIYTVVSSDGGLTFGAPALVAEVPRTLPGSVDSVVDSTRGTVLLAWNGGVTEHTDVTVARSDDTGKTWKSVILSKRSGGGAHFAAIASSPSGVIGVAWLQDTLKQNCYRAYFAASVDGGASFSMPSVVSAAESCPATPANRDVIKRFPRGGDYMGLAVGADGKFHAVWPDARDGVFSIHTAVISVSGSVGRRTRATRGPSK